MIFKGSDKILPPTVTLKESQQNKWGLSCLYVLLTPLFMAGCLFALVSYYGESELPDCSQFGINDCHWTVEIGDEGIIIRLISQGETIGEIQAAPLDIGDEYKAKAGVDIAWMSIVNVDARFKRRGIGSALIELLDKTIIKEYGSSYRIYVDASQTKEFAPAMKKKIQSKYKVIYEEDGVFIYIVE